jgi:hypothetical protein
MFVSSGDVQSLYKAGCHHQCHDPRHDKRIIATVVPPGSQDSKTPRVTSFAGSDLVGRPVVKTR